MSRNRQPRYKVTFAMGGDLGPEEFRNMLVKALVEGDRGARNMLLGEIDEIEEDVEEV